MKKLKSIICAIMLILLAGCGKKINYVPINEFEGIIGKYQYELVNSTDLYNYAEEAYILSDSNVHFEYITTNKINEAKGIYMEDFANIFNEVNGKYENEIKSDDNWSTFEVKTDERCYFMFLYNKTYIYIEMPIKNESQFDVIVDDLLS